MKKLATVFLSALLLGFSALPLQTAAAAGNPVVVAFGDSLTAAGVWVNTLKTQTGLNIINAGVGGNNSQDGRARFGSDVLNKNPDLVIICFGMNDSAKDMAKHVSPAAFKANLEYFVTALKSKGIKIILATPSYIEEEMYYTRHDRAVFESVGGAAAYVDYYCSIIREVASEQGVLLADVREACDEYEDRTKILSDGVHATALGYSLYSDRIGAQIKKLYRGDADLDGSISSFDYLMIKRHFLGSYTLDGSGLYFADVNGDGEISSFDYLAVKRHFLGSYDLNAD